MEARKVPIHGADNTTTLNKHVFLGSYARRFRYLAVRRVSWPIKSYTSSTDVTGGYYVEEVSVEWLENLCHFPFQSLNICRLHSEISSHRQFRHFIISNLTVIIFFRRFSEHDGLFKHAYLSESCRTFAPCTAAYGPFSLWMTCVVLYILLLVLCSDASSRSLISSSPQILLPD